MSSVSSKKHRRGPWSQAEDQYLLQLVQTHGAHNWVRISELIQFRSPKQCRERYHQNLKPSLNLSPISPEEGQLIERMVNEMGKRWAEIARRLHGRSDNAVKNWWNGGMNRRKRLEGRRAEAAKRIPLHRSAAIQLEQSSPQQQMPFNQQFAEYAARPAYPMDQFSQMSRMPAPPHPVLTAQPQVPSQRHLFDPSVPSPSAVSHGSHDSEDAPPSLVSDSTRTYSTHHSPTANQPAVELPPLGTVSDDKMSYYPQAQHYSYNPNVQAWPANAQDIYQTRDFTSQQVAANSYYAYAGYDGRQPMMAAPNAYSTNTYAQYQLPSFNTVTAGDVRQGDLSASSRDNRMALSKITN
ncbi:MAG: hypothetical protein Q9162_004810 [Coniocarpon cinnabarinum]